MNEQERDESLMARLEELAGIENERAPIPDDSRPVVIELRAEVKRFAEAMERKLRENEDKGGWKGRSEVYLYSRVAQELAEFRKGLDGRGHSVLGEAADVANFLMMICDVRGEL